MKGNFFTLLLLIAQMMTFSLWAQDVVYDFSIDNQGWTDYNTTDKTVHLVDTYVDSKLYSVAYVDIEGEVSQDELKRIDIVASNPGVNTAYEFIVYDKGSTVVNDGVRFAFTVPVGAVNETISIYYNNPDLTDNLLERIGVRAAGAESDVDLSISKVTLVNTSSSNLDIVYDFNSKAAVNLTNATSGANESMSANGELKVDFVGGYDRLIFTLPEALDQRIYNQVKIKINNNGGHSNWNILKFNTLEPADYATGDSNWEKREFEISTTDEFITYTINIPQNANLTDNQFKGFGLRLQNSQVGSHSVLIESVTVVANENGYVWNFDENGNVENWKPQGASIVTHGGDGTISLGWDNGNASPEMRVLDLHYTAEDYPVVQLKLKNNTPTADDITLVAQTDAGFASVTFAATASDAEFQTYSVDLSSRSAYTGLVSSLRLKGVTTGVAGSIDVDEVRLLAKNEISMDAGTYVDSENGLTYLNEEAYLGSDLTILGSATSGLPLQYRLDEASVGKATITASGVLTPLQGTSGVKVIVSSVGNDQYADAEEVSFFVKLNKGQQSITWDQDLTGFAYTGADQEVVLTADNGIEESNIWYSVSDYSVANVEDGVLIIKNAGSITVTANAPGTDSYEATTLEKELIVAKADQTITFTQPEDQEVGVEFDPGATSDSNLPVFYTTSDEAVAYVTESGLIKTVKAGTVTITATQPGNDNYNTAFPVSHTITSIANPDTPSIPNSTTWDGTSWSNGTPDATMVMVVDSDNTLSSNFTCSGITIEAGHSLNIANGTTITVQGDINNNGNGIAGSGILEIDGTVEIIDALSVESTISITTGNQLITNNQLTLENGASLYHATTGEITGNIIAKRTGDTDNKVYNYWAVPMQEGTQVTQINGGDRYYYDEPNASWQNVTASITIGQGIISTGAGTTTMTGTPYADAVTVAVTSQSSNATVKGFNLIGNVFLAPLSYTDFIGDNTNITNGTLYFYEGNADGTGVYTVVNSSNPLDVPSFQGFFIHVSADGTINFDHDHKKEAQSNSFFRKDNTTLFENFTFIASSDLYSDNVSFLKGDQFSEDDDFSFDAFKFKGSQSLSIQFDQNNKGYHVLALKEKEEYILPITIAFDNTKSIRLQLEDQNLFENYNISLVNKLNDQAFNLSEEVLLSGEGVIENQYEIHISTIAQENTGDKGDIISSVDLKKELEASIAVTSSQIMIDHIPNGNAQVMVMTYLGTQLYQGENIVRGNSTSFPFAVPENIPVIIQLFTENDHYSYKVLLKK